MIIFKSNRHYGVQHQLLLTTTCFLLTKQYVKPRISLLVSQRVFVAGVGGSSKEQQWIYCGKWRPVHGVGWQKLFKSFHISHFSVPATKFFIRFVSLDDEQTSTSTYSSSSYSSTTFAYATSKFKSFQLRVSCITVLIVHKSPP